MARTKKEAVLKKAAILRAQKRDQNKRNIALKKSIKTRASATKEQDFRCDSCPKSFTKLSNLNQHKKSKHGDGERGARIFLCPHCDEEQSTKYAHIRHFERKHPHESIDHVNENARMKSVDNSVDMTDEAKTALLARLQRENISLKEENNGLKIQIEVLKNKLAGNSQSKKKSTQPTIKVEVTKSKRIVAKSEAANKTTRNQTMDNPKQKGLTIQPAPKEGATQPKVKVEKPKRIVPEPKTATETTRNQRNSKQEEMQQPTFKQAQAKESKSIQENASTSRSVRQRIKKLDDSYVY